MSRRRGTRGTRGTREPSAAGTTAPRTSAADLLVQAFLALFGRRFRTLLTMVGISVGLAAALATLGITASAAGAVSDQFDSLKATRVTVKYPSEPVAGIRPRPDGGDTRQVRGLNGVRTAGLVSKAGEQPVVSRLSSGTSNDLPEGTVLAAQPDALLALSAELTQGRWFDTGHEARRERVALLDTAAASRLTVDGGAGNSVIHVNGVAFSVLGVFRAPAGDTNLTGSVVVPYWAALQDPAGLSFAPAEMIIRTDLGAADQIGAEAPFALAPGAPDKLVALVPPDPGPCARASSRRPGPCSWDWPPSPSGWGRSESATPPTCPYWSGAPRSACVVPWAPPGGRSPASSASRAAWSGSPAVSSARYWASRSPP